MDNKKRFILILLVLILLMASASVLYSKMSIGLDAQQLNANEATSASATENDEADNQTRTAKAPDFLALDSSGNEVRFYDFLGKPIVLNFWASWCGPCQMEMPDFEEAYKAYGDEVNFLMVNVTDGSRETVEIASAFISEKGYSFPVFYDTAMEAAYGYGVYSLPTTYFLDSEGYLVAAAKGMVDAEIIQKGINKLLN